MTASNVRAEYRSPDAFAGYGPMTCPSCGATFDRSTGRGKPRRFCPACSPSDPAACTRAWRARNAAAINAARRAAYHADPARARRLRRSAPGYVAAHRKAGR